MKKYSLLLLSLTMIGASACDHYSNKMASLERGTYNNNDNITSISPAAGGETYFNANKTYRSYLKDEYAQLAAYEHNVRQDYKAAKYYVGKIESLEEGNMVYPASFRDFNVSGEKTAELAASRQQLISAMKIYNIPENRYILARAQGRFDCWMDQIEDQPTENSASFCEIEFKEAMSSLSEPAYTDDMFYDDLFDVL